MTSPKIIENEGQSRFEMPFEGSTAFVTYRRQGDVLVLNHAEVPMALQGRGLGSVLVKATLEVIRGKGLKIVPRCPFIAAYVQRTPEFHDLVA